VLLSQVEIENQMIERGSDRALKMMATAEEHGQADRNPYAKEILAQFVLPLSEALAESVAPKAGAGKGYAHAMLLRPLALDSVAFLAVRTALAMLMGAISPRMGVSLGRKDDEVTLRTLSQTIGKTIYGELVLTQIEKELPDLYHHLVRDLGRRLSSSERHRVTVMRLQAAKAGLDVVEWPRGAAEQVGTFLVGMLENAGLVEVGPNTILRGKNESRAIYLGEEIISRIEQVREYVAKTMPMWGPCVEKPLDWVSGSGGGFHTPAMRRMHSTLARGSSETRELSRSADMPTVLTAANALQNTAWKINTRLLVAIRNIGVNFATKELVQEDVGSKPEKPAFLGDREPETLDENELKVFKLWKRQVTEWWTARKINKTRVIRLSSAIAAATKFKEYPELFFVYFADSRGRFYPMTYGVNPQGSDLQKALLMFAEGCPVDTPEAIRWFHVQGANKWGFDKATLKDRHQWVVDRQAQICAFAEDPVANRDWKDADKPLQFLAWCFEYRDWVMDKDGSFRSHIPVSMDGSCNGLQNLSAMLRDDVGGAATNLIPSDTIRDIYADVAQAAMTRLKVLITGTPEEESIKLRWLDFGIQRAAVKRSVMTTPYGVTNRSAIEYVIKDYLKAGKAPVFAPQEYRLAANVLMKAVWPAIGDVVVKGREAMAWLKSSAKAILPTLSEETPLITWTSPSGFPASQSYFEENVHRINTHLKGLIKIRMLQETDTPDKNRHASGLAPNFVHSMDAAHLHLVAAECTGKGITSLAMIHDDYGTHADKSQKLYEIIRAKFVDMYSSNDPVAEFHAKYPVTSKPPSLGTLDIKEVLRSDFFFS
jgi:DNA-directed RNA polymerase